MKTARVVIFMFALAFVATWSLSAWAADAPAAAPGSSTPTAKAKITSEVKCVVTGKLTEKTVTNKQGKERKTLEIIVATAKTADGKAVDELSGKTLRVAPKKGLKVSDFVGKDVTISGTVLNNKRLQADSIK